MTYADNYNLRTATVTQNDMANAVDGSLIKYSQETHGTLINTTSTSFVVYTGSSLTVSVASGEVVEIMATITVSHGSSGGVVAFTVEEDAVNLGTTSRWYSPVAGDTSGNISTIPFHRISAPGVGSHTYKLKWSTVAAGTAYSSKATLALRVYQAA